MTKIIIKHTKRKVFYEGQEIGKEISWEQFEKRAKQDFEKEFRKHQQQSRENNTIFKKHK